MIKGFNENGIVKSVLFYGAFMVSAIPIWFVILAAYLNKSIPLAIVIYIILVIIVCRGYMESEIIEDNNVILLSLMQIIRLILKLVLIMLIYGAFIYIVFYSAPIDHILFCVAGIAAILIFLNTTNGKQESRALFYFRGYRLYGINSIAVLLLWFYLLFVPDSLFGNFAAIIGVYIIEFMNLFKNYGQRKSEYA